jgi:hypothetical protein
MNIFIIFISIILLALFQVSVLSFFPIWGIVINIFLLITIALAIRKWDEIAPMWIGVGALLLDFLGTNKFGIYIISLGLTYLFIRWFSSRVSILIERQYLVAIWVFLGILSFESLSLLILYLSGEINNIAGYLIIILKSLIIHMLFYIPADYIVKINYNKKIKKPQINL